jgi:4-hydroxybenzoate polyprenyltransferase
MIPFLKLIRLPNLIMIALLQFFLRTYFVQPIMNSFSLNLVLSDFQFYLLMFMTSLIAAAGYIINDYFDLKIDYVNRSGDDIIIGNSIKRRVAMFLHIVLSGIGVLIGCYLAYALQIWVIALAPLLVVGLLWFYSTDYKRQFLIGNLVLAFLSIFPILILILFEPSIFQAYYSFEYRQVAILIFKVLLYYSFIAFGISLVYAILKDLHDLPGDEAVKAKTLPILAGETTAKLTITFVSVAVIFALFYIQNMQYLNNAYIPLMYIIFAIEVPLLFVNVMVYFADQAKKYSLLINFMYAIMLFGVFSILILNYFPGSN